MATALTPPALPSFDPNEPPVGPRWTKWLSRFNNYLVAADVTDPARKKALLLHYAGEAVQDIYDALPTIPTSDGSTDSTTTDPYGSTTAILTSYFAPKRNLQYEIFTFQSASQEPGETLDQFATRLRILAKYCEYTDVDREIKTRIIQSCRSNRLRRRALREDMTLTELLSIGRALETSEAQAATIEKCADTADINRIQGARRPHQKPRPTSTAPTTTCGLCGGVYPHEDGPTKCPAYGKTCFKCGKTNHFSHMCRSKTKETGYQPKQYKPSRPGTPTSRSSKPPNRTGQQKSSSVHHVTEQNDSSSDDEYVFAITSPHKHPHATVKIADTPTEVIIDSGASTNLIDGVSPSTNWILRHSWPRRPSSCSHTARPIHCRSRRHSQLQCPTEKPR